MQVGEEYRANARIGFSIHVSIVRGQNIPKGGINIVHISRVLDKGALFTVHVFQDILRYINERFTLKGVNELWHVTDAGPHYRSRINLSAYAEPVIEQLRSANGTADPDEGIYGMATTRCVIALEKHGKSDDDSFIAELKRRWEMAELKRTIWDTRQLCQVLVEYANRKTSDQGLETFIDFIPCNSKADYADGIPLIDKKSLPCGIKSAHEWSFHTKDKRRKNLHNSSGVLTGVSCRAHRLPGMKSSGELETSNLKFEKKAEPTLDVPAQAEPPEAPEEEGNEAEGPDAPDDSSARSNHSESEPSDSDEADDSEEADEEDHAVLECSSNADIPLEQKFFRGWRISWKTKSPEVANEEKTLKRLEKKWENFKDIELPPGQRHLATSEAQRKVHENATEARKKRRHDLLVRQKQLRGT